MKKIFFAAFGMYLSSSQAMPPEELTLDQAKTILTDQKKLPDDREGVVWELKTASIGGLPFNPKIERLVKEDVNFSLDDVKWFFGSALGDERGKRIAEGFFQYCTDPEIEPVLDNYEFSINDTLRFLDRKQNVTIIREEGYGEDSLEVQYRLRSLKSGPELIEDIVQALGCALYKKLDEKAQKLLREKGDPELVTKIFTSWMHETSPIVFYRPDLLLHYRNVYLKSEAPTED